MKVEASGSWKTFRKALTAARRFIRAHSEQLLFSAAMVLLFALGARFFLLAQRLTTDYFALLRDKLLTESEAHPEIAAELATIDERIERRLFMLNGEIVFFFALLIVCFLVLYAVAAQKRRAFLGMERMLQMTTHELKTPIAGVKALLQSLKLGSIPQEARTRMIDQGVAECKRLEHLSESLLAYQRALARVRRTHEVNAPGALLAAVLEGRARSFGDESIVTKLDAPSTPVIADKDAFFVIFENLLDNAKKFGAAQPIEIKGSLAGDRYTLRVSDRGVGFDRESAEQLFMPFERGDADRRGVAGSGLGLYIARSLAEELGGGLSAESAGRDRGSTFTLSLRLAAPS